MIVQTSPRYEWDTGYLVRIPTVVFLDEWTTDNRMLLSGEDGVIWQRNLPIPLLAHGVRLPSDDDDPDNTMGARNVGVVYEARYHKHKVEAYAWTPYELDGLYPGADISDHSQPGGYPSPTARYPSWTFTVWSLVGITLTADSSHPWPRMEPTVTEPWNQATMAPSQWA